MSPIILIEVYKTSNFPEKSVNCRRIQRNQLKPQFPSFLNQSYLTVLFGHLYPKKRFKIKPKAKQLDVKILVVLTFVYRMV